MVVTGTADEFSVGEPTLAVISPGFHTDVEAMAFVLDQMPIGVLLVDGSGCVVWMNRSARMLIRPEAGIALRDGRLAFASRGASNALDQCIEHAVASGGSPTPADPEAIALSRSPEESPLVAVVRPVERRGGRCANGIARAVIFLSDPAQGLRTSRERLRSLFKLTPAESDLVALLAAGASLQAAAAQLGIRNESARTYLKHAFEKTGTRRQAELVRLALTVAPAGAGET